VYAGVGIALIVFGCVLENPPKHYASAMFVAVGALNLFASTAGFWVSTVPEGRGATAMKTGCCQGECREGKH
jgi:hypothetical protein